MQTKKWKFGPYFRVLIWGCYNNSSRYATTSILKHPALFFWTETAGLSPTIILLKPTMKNIYRLITRELKEKIGSQTKVLIHDDRLCKCWDFTLCISMVISWRKALFHPLKDGMMFWKFASFSVSRWTKDGPLLILFSIVQNLSFVLKFKETGVTF